MKFKKYISAAIVLLFTVSSSYSLPVTTKYCSDVLAYGNPSLDAKPDISKPNLYLCRNGYVSGYSYLTKQPIWVAYSLSPKKIGMKTKRKDNFVADPSVPKEHSASLNDYKKSGYDRGHLAPYASMDFSKVSANESFYLSNISPQKPSLNRKGWAKLESNVRFWSAYYKGAYVITGPIYKQNKVKKTIGNKVAVPDYFFKLIYTPDKYQEPKTIAFVMPNSKVSNKDVSKYRVSIKDIEERTGLKFLDKVTKVDKSKVSKMWHTKNYYKARSD